MAASAGIGSGVVVYVYAVLVCSNENSALTAKPE